MIVRKYGEENYHLYKGTFHNKPSFFIMHDDEEQLGGFLGSVPDLKLI